MRRSQDQPPRAKSDRRDLAAGAALGLVTVWTEKLHVGASGASWDQAARLSPEDADVRRALDAARAAAR